MGVGMRITKNYCDQLTDGIFSVMREMGIWSGPVEKTRIPMIADQENSVVFMNAPTAGIFISQAAHGSHLKKGDEIGIIVDPLQGIILQRIKAPVDGLLFTVREYPVVAEGALLARILKEECAIKETAMGEKSDEKSDHI